MNYWEALLLNDPLYPKWSDELSEEAPYRELNNIAQRYEAQGYSEALSYEMAYAKIEEEI